MDKRITRFNHLLKRIQWGNEKALDEMFVEFGSLFLSMAKHYLYDKDYAEDLVSEVFDCLVSTKAKSFNPERNGLNWIHTIIRRKAQRHNEAVGKEQRLYHEA